MERLMEISLMLVSTIFDHVNLFLASFSDGSFLLEAGGGVALAFALGAVASGNITEGVLANIRRWHGSIDEQFGSIDNLVNILEMHHIDWQVPPDLLMQLTDNRNRVQALINKCRTPAASTIDRNSRNMLLKSTVGLCVLQVKMWAYGQFFVGVITADGIHLLGFLLPGEAGGHHDRTEATNIMAEVKASVINEDFVRVVIDQSAGENAAKVVHGWPQGVRNALIVIAAADGKTEVLRQTTTHLHNDIRMPEGSHGKQFIIKAAFLKHTDDEPRFGNEPTFSMPLTTADLAAALDRQHHEDFEAQMREVERHRQEIERLQEALNVKK